MENILCVLCYLYVYYGNHVGQENIFSDVFDVFDSQWKKRTVCLLSVDDVTTSYFTVQWWPFILAFIESLLIILIKYGNRSGRKRSREKRFNF